MNYRTTCLYCARSMTASRRTQLYCSGACKQKAYRHRNKQGGYATTERVCKYCHKAFYGFGRALYCSDACKSAMYRKRREAGKQTFF